MKREVLNIKAERQKRRAQFLFNDGQYRPKAEKSVKTFRRQPKHRNSELDFGL